MSAMPSLYWPSLSVCLISEASLVTSALQNHVNVDMDYVKPCLFIIDSYTYAKEVGARRSG